MKRKIGKFLAIAAMIPCALFATACGKDDLDQEKAYSTVRSAIIECASYQGSLSTVGTTKTTYTKEAPYETISEMGYNSTTGEYYEIETIIDGDNEYEESSLYVKKVEDNHIMYESERHYNVTEQVYEYERSANYVSADHAAKEILDFDVSGDFAGVLVDCDTLDEFKDTVFDEMPFEEGLEITLSKVYMQEKNGTYILKVEFGAEGVEEAADDEPKTTMAIKIMMEYEVKDNKFVGYNVEFSNDVIVSEGSDAEKMSSNTKMNTDIKYTYVDKMIDNTNQYPEAVNDDYYLNYYLDGRYQSCEPIEFGATIEPLKVSDFSAYENTTIEGWYLDKECTQEFDPEMTMPSYEVCLYAKSVANEGYTVVVYEYHYEGENNSIDAGNETVVIAIPEGEETVQLTIPCYNPEHNNEYNNLDTFDVTYGTIVVNGENVTIPTEGDVTITLDEQGYYHIVVNSTLTAKPVTE